MKSFEIDGNKAIIRDIPTYGWLRKEDVLYEIMSTIEIWEDQIKHYEEKNSMYYEINGKIIALRCLLDEIQRA